MKKIFFLLLIATFGFYYFLKEEYDSLTVTSPLPDVLSQVFQKTLGATTHWEPNISIDNQNKVEKLITSSSSALSYDITLDKLLYGKNLNTKLPIASITKIMTALVAIENEQLDKKITITKDMLVGENSMGIQEGEVLTLESLLYGLILPSGNDAAEAIARGSKVGRDNFIYMMNKKAEDLGLSNTHFTNPSGLEGDGDQYSTAEDLLVITRFALENQSFSKIVSTFEYHIPSSDEHKEYNLYNDTNLLTSYPGVKGVKSGFTDEAGYCLVSFLDYEGHKIIAILLNSENRRQDMKDLLDYSLESLGVRPPLHL